MSSSAFASWGGRGSGTRGPAGSDYRSVDGSVAVPEQDVSADVARSLRSTGLKVRASRQAQWLESLSWVLLLLLLQECLLLWVLDGSASCLGLLC